MYFAQLKTSFRFLKKNIVFTGISGIGLSISLAVSFIILIYVINEFSYDSMHENRAKLFRVVNYHKQVNMTFSGTPYILGTTLKHDFPQVKEVVTLKRVRGFRLKLKDEMLEVPNAMYTDNEVFQLFEVKLLERISNHPDINDKNLIMLSKKMAEKFFPGTDAIGKTITGLVNNEQHDFTISGIFDDLPLNSSLKPDCFLSNKWFFEDLNNTFKINDAEKNWTMEFWNTWILLNNPKDFKYINEHLTELEKKYFSKDPDRHFSLQNLSDLHLQSENIANSDSTGSMKKIKLYMVICILIITVAAINYIILSIAVSAGRIKEIAVRKTFGAGKWNISQQMITESILLSFMVLPISFILTLIALPYSEKIFETQVQIINSNLVTYLVITIGLVALIGLISSLYTTTYLSRMKIMDTLKNTIQYGRRRVYFRSILIIVQIVIFCSFITSALVIKNQYNYALSKDLGYSKHDIIFLNLGRDFKEYRSLINNIKTYPDVISAAGSMFALPTDDAGLMMYSKYNNKEIKVKVEGLAVDYGFLETMGIEILAGRGFSENYGSDLKNSMIFNQSAIRQLEIPDPIGKEIDGGKIIGVVKDFNLHSIRDDIPPLVISITDEYIEQVAIHYKSGSLHTLLPKIEKEWKKLAPDKPFMYNTIEDVFKEIYATERELTILVSIFALFTILIAMFGLFGLTLYLTKTRTKEIGIKRVLGSSESSIFISFLKENLLLVLIASVIAVFPTIYFMTKWLNDFAYHIKINPVLFIFSFAIASLVVILTVSYHAFKASRTNPIEAIRYE